MIVAEKGIAMDQGSPGRSIWRIEMNERVRGLALCPIAAIIVALFFLAPKHAGGKTILSNGIYVVHVAEINDGFSIGSWNAFTAAGHPTGPDNFLTFGSFVPDPVNDPNTIVTVQETNFSTLRVYGSGGTTDYSPGAVARNEEMQPPQAEDLDAQAVSEPPSPFGPNGHRTIWDIGAEGLRVTQDVVIAGMTFTDSAIYHTVLIQNTGSNQAQIGWRNLYDWQVGATGALDFDDGPANQVETSDETVIVGQTPIEFSHAPGPNELVRVSISPGVADYEPLLSLSFDPGFLPALPTTAPDEYAYAFIDTPSLGDLFDYQIGPLNVGDPNENDDSVGLSWFGRDAARAIQIAPGSSIRLTQAMFAVVPGGAAPQIVPIPGAAAGGLAMLAVASLTACRRWIAATS
jgi:hypothetical protein